MLREILCFFFKIRREPDTIKVTKPNSERSSPMFKDYNTTQTILPLDLEIMIDPTDISDVIHEFVESLPEKVFDLFEKETGRSPEDDAQDHAVRLCSRDPQWPKDRRSCQRQYPDALAGARE
jgi:hypothetical protein